MKILLQIWRIYISNHIAVGVIGDISPNLFHINLEITTSVSEGDFKIDNKITRMIYLKSHELQCFLINHIFTDKDCAITSTTSKQRGGYKIVGWLQNSGASTTESIDLVCTIARKNGIIMQMILNSPPNSKIIT